MWRKEDGNPQASPEADSGTVNSTSSTKSGSSAAAPLAVSPRATACVSQGIKIKGELAGSEDLFIDGQIDGKISLSNAVLTVGPNATVKADIAAREVVLRGRAEGKFVATDRIQIWNTARVQAELKSERILIEEGAELHGRIEAGKVHATSSVGHGRKGEVGKAKDSSSTDEKNSSGAATAGAD